MGLSDEKILEIIESNVRLIACTENLCDRIERLEHHYTKRCDGLEERTSNTERRQQYQSGAIAALAFVIPLVWGLVSFSPENSLNLFTGESVILGEPGDSGTIGRVGIDWITAFREF